MKKIFQMPKPVTISQRSSSITNAFVNGIIPVIQPTEDEIDQVLTTLGMNRNNICCAYCGNPYTEWDHFRPIVKDKKPTGYVSEIHNLVPSCGKCNQSKGNKYWKDWILSEAAQSPKTRKIQNLDERIKRLEDYESRFTPVWFDFEVLVGKEKWNEYWENYEELIQAMRDCQILSNEIRKSIYDRVKK